MSHDEPERLREERRLEEELAKMGAEISALSPQARERRANAIRTALHKTGRWNEHLDGPVLASFIGGQIGIEELAKHFAGRV